jgi:hypothetical protein
VLNRALVLGGLAIGLTVSLTGCTDPEVAAFDREAFSAVLADGKQAQEKVEDITERLARACMEDAGYSIHPVPQKVSEAATPVPGESDNVEIVMGARFMYQADTIDEAGYGASQQERFGYQPGGDDDPFVNDPFDELSEEEQWAYWMAYDGGHLRDYAAPDGLEPTPPESITVNGREYSFPVVGCYADVEQQIHQDAFGDYLSLSHFAREGLAYVAFGEFHGDPRLEVGLVDWSDCMADNGYPDLSGPDEAGRLASRLYSDANVFGPGDPGFVDVKAQEIQIAQTDYACNRQVSLDEGRVEIFWEHLEPYAIQHETEVFAWKERTDDALARAQDLLSQY